MESQIGQWMVIIGLKYNMKMMFSGHCSGCYMNKQVWNIELKCASYIISDW